MRSAKTERTRVRIPADVDRDDVVLGRLTARQVALLAVTGVVLWLVFLATKAWLPLPVFLGAAVPIAGVAVALAFGRRDGVSLDRLAWAALRQTSQPRRLVNTHTDSPAGAVSAPPAWVDGRGDQTPVPAPLRLPAEAIQADGVVDLGVDGAVAVLAVSTVNFALATDAEQQAMVTGFGRWLNSLSDPVQVVVRTERISLTGLVTRLEQAAGGLPHLALEEAAREHSAFLAQIAAEDLRARQVLLVLRDRDGGEDAPQRLTRRCDDAARALQACGLTASRLDGEGVRRLLARACRPPPAGTAAPIITRRKESDRCVP